MTTQHQTYANPLVERYASTEMLSVFSADHKFQTWRRLWIALAKTQQELGLPITNEQIEEMEQHQKSINYDVAKAKEKEIRHDVMSHVHAFGVQCPKQCQSFIWEPPVLMWVITQTWCR
jgi:adenylosuccinate lyase